MKYRYLEHASVVVIALGAGSTAISSYFGLPVIAVICGVVTALGSVGKHFFGKAAEKESHVYRSDHRQPSDQVERSEALITLPQNSSDLHSEIDEATEFIKTGQPEVAIKILGKLKKRWWDQFSEREKYRLLANLGNARLSKGDKDNAAQDYIRAVEYQPEDEDARSLEALGYWLLRDRARAHKQATALCRDHPGLGRAQMIRIRSAPEETPFEELVESVPLAVRNDPEVALALHDRALAEDRLTDAEQVLRKYSGAEKEWPPLTLALGSTLLQQQLSASRLTSEGLIPPDPERLLEAINLFSSAIQHIPEADPQELAFGAYFNRGTCRSLLGEPERACDDFRQARDLQPSDERVAISLARSAHAAAQDFDEAIETLDQYNREYTSIPVQVLLAQFLRQRAASKDLEHAVEILENMVPSLPEIEEEEQKAMIVATLADIYAITDRVDEAVNLAQDVAKEVLGDVMSRVVLGNVLYQAQETQAAVAEAHAASDSLGDSTDWSEVWHTAFLLERLGEFKEAFNLWRRIVSPDLVSPDTLHLLHCAKESGQDQFVLNFCQQLREAGHYDFRAIHFETDTLRFYNEFAVARDVLVEYLELNPQDKHARLELTTLAIQQQWTSLIEDNPAMLPAVDEVETAELGGLVVEALRHGGNSSEALNYSYQLYRRFPDDAAAHKALITALIMPGPDGLSLETPESVAPGVAVCYSVVGSPEQHWLVVEDAKDPSLSREEYPDTHAVVQEMLGKKIGEEFSLSEGGFRDRTGIVVEIQDKRVYRANALMRSWREHFPEIPFLELIPMKLSDAPSQEDFAELIKTLEKIKAPREKIVEAYVNGQLPIATFATLIGRTVFETMTHLAANPDFIVHACQGSGQEQDSTLKLLEDVQSVVLEPTAIATLGLLEEENALETLPFRCLVTEGTLQEIRSLILQSDFPTRQPLAYVASNEGRLWIHEVDSRAESRRADRLQELISNIEQHCEIIGGSDLAQLEAHLRDDLLQYIPKATAESIAAATVRSATLWTDDHLLYELTRLLNNEQVPAKVWTQIVFMWAEKKGLPAGERRSQVTARMLRFGYVFTSLNSPTVLDICESANWQVGDPDLAAVLGEFGNLSWEYEMALQITVKTVSAVWQNAPTSDHARAITTHLLVHLADRQDHRQVVRILLGSVDSLVSLAVTRAAPLRDTLQTFLQTGVPPL